MSSVFRKMFNVFWGVKIWHYDRCQLYHNAIFKILDRYIYSCSPQHLFGIFNNVGYAYHFASVRNVACVKFCVDCFCKGYIVFVF